MADNKNQASSTGKFYDSGTEELPIVDVENVEETDDTDDIDVTNLWPYADLDGTLTRMLERFASYSMGQWVIRTLDHALGILEDTTKWSLPLDSFPANNPRRPLPWPIFLLLIIFLRVSRFFLSHLGSNPVTPESIVHYVQVKRRSLRILRVRGLRIRGSPIIERPVIRSTQVNRENQEKSENEKNQETPSLKDMKAIKQSQRGRTQKKTFENGGEKGKLVKAKGKRKTQVDCYEENTAEKLEKYAKENSSDDSDYQPTKEEINKLENSLSVYNTSNIEDYSETQTDITRSEDEIGLRNEVCKQNGITEKYMSPEFHDKTPFPIVITNEKNEEEMHSPEGMSPVQDTDVSSVTTDLSAATTEVASPSNSCTSKTTLNCLAAPQFDESNKKSTPGHKSAASAKPPHSNEANTAGSTRDFYYTFHPAPITQLSNDEDFIFS